MPLLLLILAASPAVGASAQAPRHFEPPARGAVQLGVDLGHTRFAVSGIRPDGTRFSMFLGAHLTPRVAWTFDITCLGGTPVGALEDQGFTICTGSLGGQLEVGVTSHVRPYLRAGLGQSQLDWQAELDVFDIDERGGATTAALGTRVTLGRTGRYALRAEIAWMRDDVLGVGATHRSIALGIAYRMR